MKKSFEIQDCKHKFNKEIHRIIKRISDINEKILKLNNEKEIEYLSILDKFSEINGYTEEFCENLKNYIQKEFDKVGVKT